MPFMPSKFTELHADQKLVLKALDEPMNYAKISEHTGLAKPRTLGVLNTLRMRELVYNKKVAGSPSHPVLVWLRTEAGDRVAKGVNNDQD